MTPDQLDKLVRPDTMPLQERIMECPHCYQGFMMFDMGEHIQRCDLKTKEMSPDICKFCGLRARKEERDKHHEICPRYLPPENKPIGKVVREVTHGPDCKKYQAARGLLDVTDDRGVVVEEVRELNEVECTCK